MTYQEAIKVLVNATYSDEWQGNEDITTAQHMAVDALEKQIPMKPENGQDDNFYWGLVCPKCKNVLLEEFYCPECGQHIDWSDEENHHYICGQAIDWENE